MAERRKMHSDLVRSARLHANSDQSPLIARLYGFGAGNGGHCPLVVVGDVCEEASREAWGGGIDGRTLRRSHQQFCVVTRTVRLSVSGFV